MNPSDGRAPQRGPSVEHGREPCPDRILDDIGGAFGMGALGGGLWHYFLGMRKSPSGQKFKGGFQAIRGHGPRLGGSFAVWGGLFSSFDCTLAFLRRKEDPWNPIASGALTAGMLSLRSGLMHSMRSAFLGGLILTMIEGLQIMMTKMSAPPPPRMASMQANMPPHMQGIGMPPQPPPFGATIAPGVMATAQSQPEVMPPSFEDPTKAQENQQQGSWSSWFGFGQQSSNSESLEKASASSTHYQSSELK
eukprot:g1915.t1